MFNAPHVFMNCLAGHLKKIRMEAANEDKPRCHFCGNELILDDSQMCSDVNVDYEGDEEAMVHFSHCPKCGRSYEIFDPTKEEREKYYDEYWNENG